MKKPKPLPSWRITVIRKRGERVGTVSAASAEEEIQVAIKEFLITDPERQRRLVAQRVERRETSMSDWLQLHYDTLKDFAGPTKLDPPEESRDRHGEHCDCARRTTFAPSGRDLTFAKASARCAYDRARRAGALSSAVIDKAVDRNAARRRRAAGGDGGGNVSAIRALICAPG